MAIEAEMAEEPALLHHYQYLNGILCNERDHNYEKAETLFVGLLSEQIPDSFRAQINNGLATTFGYKGQWQKAIQINKDTLIIYKELSDPFEQAKVLNNIANICDMGFSNGDLDSSYLQFGIQSCNNALDILQNPSLVFTHGEWLKMTIWNVRGLLNKHKKNYEDAKKCFKKHLEFAKRENNSYCIGLALGNLGEVHQLQGPSYFDDALSYYHESLSIFNEIVEIADQAEVLANMASLHWQMEEYKTALTCFEQAIALTELIRAENASGFGRADYAATISNLRENAFLLCLESGNLGSAFSFSEQARARAFLDTFGSTTSTNLANTHVASLTDVQSLMPENCLLLTYFTTGLLEIASHRITDADRDRHRFPQAKTILFAVTHDEVTIHDLDLPPNVLRPDSLGSVIESHFLSESIRQTLFQKLLEPIFAKLATKQVVYVAPHGPLHYVPFHALIASDGRPIVRNDGPSFIRIISGSALVQNAHIQRQEQNESMMLLSFGFNGTGQGSELLLAEAESAHIADLTDGRSLDGITAKQQAIFQQASEATHLHFACHGEFLADAPLQSFLEIAPNERLSAETIMDELRLNCELVTLSACETGISQVKRSDELMGLMRAFFFAGTRNLLATLWRVDGRATLIFMMHFYRQLLQGVPLVNAMHNSKLFLQKLTRRDARGLLAEALQNSMQTSAMKSVVLSLSTPDRDQFEQILTGVGLRGTARQDTKIVDLGRGDDDEQVYTDAAYWAAYVLFTQEIQETEDAG